MDGVPRTGSPEWSCLSQSVPSPLLPSPPCLFQNPTTVNPATSAPVFTMSYIFVVNKVKVVTTGVSIKL